MSHDVIISETFDADDFKGFIKFSSPFFTPPLCERVELEEYSAKLSKYAHIHVGKSCDEIVGAVAFYCNDFITYRAYLTYLFVLPKMQGRGLGARLLVAALGQATISGMKNMSLEVNATNGNACRLYMKHGYSICETYTRNDHTVYRMSIQLNAGQ